MNEELILQHGLTLDEFQVIRKYLNRDLSIEELGIFSAMWNEHCCYKTSKKWLKKLPTDNEIVIQGPGENAGVIDLQDNDGIAFKIESHNHPSYIEPFNGSATGVGGILRDIFTMGARPIATLDSIRFGLIETEKTKYLLNGVVHGIGTMVTVLEFLISVVSVSLSQHMILIIWLMLWLWDMFKKIKFFTLNQNLLVA